MARIYMLFFIIGVAGCTTKQAEPISEVTAPIEKPVQVEPFQQEAPVMAQEPVLEGLTPEEKLDSAEVEMAVKRMQPSNASGEGEWILTGYVSNEEFIEDPDVLTLLPNGKYFVFNDFYGKASFPVIEKGFFEIDLNNKTLTLKNRKLYETGYSFLEDESATVKIRIKELTRVRRKQ